MTPQLVITAGPDKGRVFPFVAGETLQIGRSQATATKLIVLLAELLARF
jgi:hypothetical protein